VHAAPRFSHGQVTWGPDRIWPSDWRGRRHQAHWSPACQRRRRRQRAACGACWEPAHSL